MDGAPLEQLRESLIATRDEADRMLAEAEENATRLATLAADTDRALGSARISRLQRLRSEAEAQAHELSGAYAGMAEAMAGAAGRLVEIAHEADFSIPPWPAGIGHTIEVKLSETREVTIRVASEPPRWSGGLDRP